jgi:hypothetical protein
MPQRTIHQADALAWLADPGVLAGCSVITSLPDWSELPELSLDEWLLWFERAATLIFERVPPDGVAIFFQSDIRTGGQWIDKGAIVQRAAHALQIPLLFHTIVCRRAPGTVTYSRASWSHMIGFSRGVRPEIGRSTADVIVDGGFKPGPKSMGVNACLAACRFVLTETDHRTIVDPFCGLGTVLAVANQLGLDAIGVDLSARQCRKAKALDLDLEQAVIA